MFFRPCYCWRPLLLLASPAVPVVSCAAVGPAVDVFLPLLFRPWSPYCGSSYWCCCLPFWRCGLFCYGVSTHSWRTLLLLTSLLFLVSLRFWLPCCHWLSCCYGVSAVAGDPLVAVHCSCCSFKKSNILKLSDYRTIAIRQWFILLADCRTIDYRTINLGTLSDYLLSD